VLYVIWYTDTKVLKEYSIFILSVIHWRMKLYFFFTKHWCVSIKICGTTTYKLAVLTSIAVKASGFTQETEPLLSCTLGHAITLLPHWGESVWPERRMSCPGVAIWRAVGSSCKMIRPCSLLKVLLALFLVRLVTHYRSLCAKVNHVHVCLPHFPVSLAFAYISSFFAIVIT
jgi:hypothetical protein